ncbi:MAG TPA: hypothetical protein VMV05_06225 [bacterium]|nr:hypothetical protein [bacterium]
MRRISLLNPCRASLSAAVLGILLCLAPPARAFNRNIFLFDFRNLSHPTVYLSQDDLGEEILPAGAKGGIKLSDGELDKTIQRHFRRARGVNRLMTRAQVNEKLQVYVVLQGSDKDLAVVIQDLSEESRDIPHSLEVVEERRINGTGSSAPDRPYFVHKEFPLQFTRARLTQVVSVDGRQATVQALTGPQEDVFMGANLPMDYFTTKGEAVPPGAQPHEFYLSLDYIPFGDLYLQDLQPDVHLFAKAAADPFDSIGIGLGARLPNFWAFMDLSNVTVTWNLVRNQEGGTENFYWVCQVGYNLFSLFPGLFQ